MNTEVEKAMVRIDPILVGIEAASEMLSISATAFKALERTGQIGPLPVELGTCRRRLCCVDELRRWAGAGCPKRESWQMMKKDFLKN